VLKLVVELRAQVPLEHEEAAEQRERQDRHHQEDDLRGQALPHVVPEGQLQWFLPGELPQCNNQAICQEVADLRAECAKPAK
jgi:hypothetical protein